MKRTKLVLIEIVLLIMAGVAGWAIVMWIVLSSKP
jgi:hypothetical protein